MVSCHLDENTRKEQWTLAFEKIPLEIQPKIMKKFVEEMPKFEYIQECRQYLDNKMEQLYRENINQLASTNESQEILEDEENEEMEEIDSVKEEELLEKLNLNN